MPDYTHVRVIYSINTCQPRRVIITDSLADLGPHVAGSGEVVMDFPYKEYSEYVTQDGYPDVERIGQLVAERNDRKLLHTLIIDREGTVVNIINSDLLLGDTIDEAYADHAVMMSEVKPNVTDVFDGEEFIKRKPNKPDKLLPERKEDVLALMAAEAKEVKLSK